MPNIFEKRIDFESKLRFLPPEMIEAIMNGTQDPELNVKKLIAITNEHVE